MIAIPLWIIYPAPKNKGVNPQKCMHKILIGYLFITAKNNLVTQQWRIEKVINKNRIILHSNMKEWTKDTCNKMDDSHNYINGQQKPDTIAYTVLFLWNSNIVWNQNRVTYGECYRLGMY